MLGYESFSNDATVERLIARYKSTGRAAPVDFRKLVPSLVHADRATHLLHPYPAKLLMHIPFFFLANEVFSRAGDVVSDPFCGSGTVLLESQLAGRSAIGADCNPFARLLTQVKVTPIPDATLEASCKRLISRIDSTPKGAYPDVVNLNHWFYPHVVRKLQCIKDAIEKTRREDVRDFFRICLSACMKKVSLADPRLAVPVRLREGQYPPNHPLRAKSDTHLRNLRRVDVLNTFKEILSSNCVRLQALGNYENLAAEARVIANDSRLLASSCETIASGRKVQLVITSPPYPGAQKYIRSSCLSLGWLDLCRSSELMKYKHRTIGREEFRKNDYEQLVHTGVSAADSTLKSIHQENPVRATIAATYLVEMRETIDDIWDQLEVGGHFVLVAANNQICGRKFKTQQHLRRIAEERGFRTKLRLIDDIRSRGLMTKRNKSASIITQEWVHVFVKE